VYREDLEAIQEGAQDSFAASSQPVIPPVDLYWISADPPGIDPKTGKRVPLPNPIRASLQQTARSLDQAFDLKIPGARPIFLDLKKLGARYQLTEENLKDRDEDELPEAVREALKPLVGKSFDDRNGFAKELKKCLSAEQLDQYESPLLARATSYPYSFDPEIMRSSADTWNQQPISWSPRNPPLAPEANGLRGTLNQKGFGPFTLGVALETELPASWGKSSGAAAVGKTRIVVLGSGGLFLGKKLSADREKLLLDCCNWLVGRDDLLTKDTGEQGLWRYPRVTRYDERELTLWHLGTQAGLPLLFGVLGIAVFLVRKLR
jgi:hypothetical protein